MAICIFYRIDGVNLYSVQLPSVDPYLVFMMRQLIVLPSGVQPVGCLFGICTMDVIVLHLHLFETKHCESVQLHTAFIKKVCCRVECCMLEFICC